MLIRGEKIKLIVADDHPLIAQGFKNLFFLQDEIELLAIASNGKELIELISKHVPHVIILDIKMPVMDGRQACSIIHKEYPNVGVLAFSMFDDETTIMDMKAAGASGYLLKNTDAEEITKAVRAVYEGGEYYCKAIKKRISHLFKSGSLGPAIDEKKQEYTDIELEIIRLVCKELTSKEIASSLQLTRRTIEHYKEKIQEKMGVQSSVGIVVYAMKHWLLY